MPQGRGGAPPWVRKEPSRNAIQNGSEKNRSEIRRRTQNRSGKTGMIVFIYKETVNDDHQEDFKENEGFQ
jgi:hypothetical protein